MAALTPDDVLVAARRLGWNVSPSRARQIVEAALPRLEAFERVRARLTYEDDAMDFMAALSDCRFVEGAGE